MGGLFSFYVGLVIWFRPGIGLMKKESILFWLWLWTWAMSLGPELKKFPHLYAAVTAVYDVPHFVAMADQQVLVPGHLK